MYVLIYLPIFNSIFNKSNLRMSIGYLQPLVHNNLTVVNEMQLFSDKWHVQI